MRGRLGSTALAVTLAMMSAGNAISQTPSPPGPESELAERNNAEVALGKTATTKAQSPAVRAFADMMVKVHSAALTQLNMKPNAKHQATIDRLSNLSGMEFDREYMRVMITDHEEALSFLERQSKAGNTPLSKTCEKMIPAVREHLQQAQKIQKDLVSKIGFRIFAK